MIWPLNVWIYTYISASFTVHLCKHAVMSSSRSCQLRASCGWHPEEPHFQLRVLPLPTSSECYERLAHRWLESNLQQATITCVNIFKKKISSLQNSSLRMGIGAEEAIDKFWVSTILQRKMLIKWNNDWFLIMGSNPSVCYATLQNSHVTEALLRKVCIVISFILALIRHTENYLFNLMCYICIY